MRGVGDQRREHRGVGEMRSVVSTPAVGLARDHADEVVAELDRDVVEHQRRDDLVGAELAPWRCPAGSPTTRPPASPQTMPSGMASPGLAERRQRDIARRQRADIDLPLHAHRELAGLEHQAEGEAGDGELGGVVDPQADGAHARIGAVSSVEKASSGAFEVKQHDDEGDGERDDQRAERAPGLAAYRGPARRAAMAGRRSFERRLHFFRRLRRQPQHVGAERLRWSDRPS